MEKALGHQAAAACQKQSSAFLLRASVLGCFSLRGCKFFSKAFGLLPYKSFSAL